MRLDWRPPRYSFWLPRTYVSLIRNVVTESFDCQRLCSIAAAVTGTELLMQAYAYAVVSDARHLLTADYHQLRHLGWR